MINRRSFMKALGIAPVVGPGEITRQVQDISDKLAVSGVGVYDPPYPRGTPILKERGLFGGLFRAWKESRKVRELTAMKIRSQAESNVGGGNMRSFAYIPHGAPPWLERKLKIDAECVFLAKMYGQRDLQQRLYEDIRDEGYGDDVEHMDPWW